MSAAALPAETPPVNSGRVLVLENDRALEGDIHREGENYRVRRTVGEVCLPGDKVRALCAGWEEAFAFVRAEANLRDPEERLRLARWCQAYGLRDHALAEATAALQMRPSDGASRQLVALLKRPTPVHDTKPPAPAAKSPPTPASAPPAIDLSAESLGVFASRVQPVLMNTCASCHATGKTSTFSLVRAGAGTAGRRATQQNLAAVLAHIDPLRPNASPLLMRAVTDHGKTGQAPLKAQSPPYRIVQEWIHFTLAGNPFLREQALASAASPGGTPKTPEGNVIRWPQPAESPTAAASGHSLPDAAAKQAPVISRPMANARELSAPSDSRPSPAAVGPADDFDPAPYNRQFHPTRGPSAP